MTEARPTFSSAWHRVAGLRPRLRAGVRVTRQRFRGRLWYLFHDPSSTSHYRMSRPAYALAGRLDGRRTVDDAWKIASEELGDDAPTQDEAITVLGQMHRASLLHADLPGDAELLLRTRTRERHRQTRGYLYNILFARFRVADPDALLGVLRPILGPLFSAPGLVFWALLLALSAAVAAVHWPRLVAECAGIITPGNLAMLYAASVFSKLLHEAAHGVACKQMAHAEGAPESMTGVHAIGVMLLVFVPFPYIDASASWTLRSRARRAVVGAAGMMSDLAFAALAVLLWSRTSPDASLHRFALNLALVGSVSSIFFNANPLMRFDGYYILTDLIGQPNLYQRARDALFRACRVVFFGTREPDLIAASRAESALLITYGVASAAYRVLISVGIIVLIASQWFALAIPLACLAVVAFLVVPLGKLIAFLANSPRLARVRRRAVGVTIAGAVAVALLVGIVPVPDRVRAAGVVEPVVSGDLYADAPGLIEQIAKTGERVTAGGSTVLQLANPELAARVASLEARLRAVTLQRRSAIGDDPAAALAYAQQEAALASQLDEARARVAALRIAAPHDGVWMPADDALVPGAFVERAQPVGRVLDPARLRVRVPITQVQAGVVAASDRSVELRARGDAARTTPGVRGEMTRADRKRDELTQPFEVLITLDPSVPVRAGQVVEVRFTAPSKPILARVLRSVRQTLQRAAGSVGAPIDEPEINRRGRE